MSNDCCEAAINLAASRLTRSSFICLKQTTSIIKSVIYESLYDSLRFRGSRISNDVARFMFNHYHVSFEFGKIPFDTGSLYELKDLSSFSIVLSHLCQSVTM